MKQIFTCLLSLMAAQMLLAQADGILRLNVDMNCIVDAYTPAITTGAGGSLMGVDVLYVDNSNGADFANYTTWVPVAMDDTDGDLIYTVDLVINGGNGNSRVDYVFRATVDDGAGGTTTVFENLGNDVGKLQYGCDVKFANDGGNPLMVLGTRRLEFILGNQNRAIKTPFGSCDTCTDVDLTHILDAGCNAGNVFFRPGGGHPVGNVNGNAFPFIPMTDDGNGRYTVTVTVPKSANYNYNYNITTAPSGAEVSILSAAATAVSGASNEACDVYDWGSRKIWSGSASTKTVESVFASLGSTPVNDIVPFAANTTVTADASCELADGYTYYTNGSNLLLAINWGAETPAAATDVSVSFGASEAEWFTDGTGFIDTQTPEGGAAMLRRVYDVNASITNPVDVRYYYTNAEFAAVNTLISNMGGTQLASMDELDMYKVTSTDNPLTIADIDETEVIIIRNTTATPSETEYLLDDATCASIMSMPFTEYKVASFSGGGGGGASGGASLILPVELVDFSAKSNQRKVQLNWITAAEINNDYFDVEHSSNGRDFKVIGQVSGHGNSNQLINYDFLHQTPVNGKNYYRLTAVDFTGLQDQSAIVSVNLTPKETLNVFPSVVDANYLNINFTGENTDIFVYNQTGKMVLSQSLDLATGTNQLEVSELPSGIYYLMVQDGTVRETVKFVKR